MKLIAIEEHFLTAEIRTAWDRLRSGRRVQPGLIREKFWNGWPIWGEGASRLWTKAGWTYRFSVTMPALHNLEPEEGVILARRTNDLATMGNYPHTFQGFATLPTAAPEEGHGRC